MKNISTYIKQVRRKLNLSQEQMAGLIGKKRYCISDYETGRSRPPIEIFIKIQALEEQSKTFITFDELDLMYHRLHYGY